ncbi:hypothetical protein GCM10010423_60300 [Streptomyces levis]|uniref:Secreted protein n=1 Tax=Streptomyces levis TaxID=285566 RepID=A0ABN3P0G4_9ACTN
MEQATTICRLALARLASRSRSTRSRSRAAVFAAWLFRLLMVMFSVGDAHTFVCGIRKGGLLVLESAVRTGAVRAAAVRGGRVASDEGG